jgi:3-oxoacyl-[acyl-carrier protein] reductase
MTDRIPIDALVTGAGAADGIGFATARLLGASGLAVALASTTDRIHERVGELRALGIRAVGFVGDLTRYATAEELFATVGPVSVLVNNAGMGSTREPAVQKRLADYTEADWDRMIDITLKTAFCTTRAFLPPMIAAGYGRIVNVASVTGPYVANPGETAYSAAKAGMVGLTRALALEVASQGITVNAVAPGWIATGASGSGELAAGANSPTRRAGTPQEVAHAVAFLAGRGASYINGETLVVDGANILQEYKGAPADYY